MGFTTRRLRHRQFQPHPGRHLLRDPGVTPPCPDRREIVGSSGSVHVSSYQSVRLVVAVELLLQFAAFTLEVSHLLVQRGAKVLERVKEAVAVAQVVIGLANSLSFEEKAVLEFF